MHNSKFKMSEQMLLLLLLLLLLGIISVFTVFFMASPALKGKFEFLYHIPFEVSFGLPWSTTVQKELLITQEKTVCLFCRSRISSCLSSQYWLYEEVSKPVPSVRVSASSKCLEHAGPVHHVPLLAQFIPIKRED